MPAANPGFPAFVHFGRELAAAPQQALEREWLVTNGRGGFASGTIAGVPTRRYHGLLISARKPPLDRVVVVSRIIETVRYAGLSVTLSGGLTTRDTCPDGLLHLESFHLDGTMPVWRYALADALLEKRIWMVRGSDTTVVRYALLRGSAPLTITGRLTVNNRDFHENTAPDDFIWTTRAIAGGVRVDLGAGPTAAAGWVRFLSDSATITPVPDPDWSEPHLLPVETERGLPDDEVDAAAAVVSGQLEAGQSCAIWLTADPGFVPGDAAAALAEWRAREQALIARSPFASGPEWVQQLTLAADQFLVQRPIAGQADGLSVLAGFPWFGDWGRDTMIALPGLTLATGRHDDAARILRTFARFVDRGMLPNRFPDIGDQPEYNTVDATLWYFEAIRAYHAATGDDALVRDLYPTLRDIVAWHERGTRYGIAVDPADGLLRAGEPGVQLTWMDVRIKDWVVTPRTGKAVEINALWHNALCSMESFARLLGHADQAAGFAQRAAQVRASFTRFWRPDVGLCYDVIDTPDGVPDASLRPNQVIAASLHYSPLSREQTAAIVTHCGRALLTSLGLHSLTPDDPHFHPRFTGDQPTRDEAYHQGTIWGWLIGPYSSAHLRAFGDPDAARALLEPFALHLRTAGLGQISEVFEAAPPHLPKACFAQAWSVGEVLRAWAQIAATP